MKQTLEIRKYGLPLRTSLIKKITVDSFPYCSVGIGVTTTKEANWKIPTIQLISSSEEDIAIWVDNVPDGFTVDLEHNKNTNTYFIKPVPIEAPAPDKAVVQPV